VWTLQLCPCARIQKRRSGGGSGVGDGTGEARCPRRTSSRARLRPLSEGKDRASSTSDLGHDPADGRSRRPLTVLDVGRSTSYGRCRRRRRPSSFSVITVSVGVCAPLAQVGQPPSGFFAAEGTPGVEQAA